MVRPIRITEENLMAKNAEFSFATRVLVIIDDKLTNTDLALCRPDSNYWTQEWNEIGDTIRRLYLRYVSSAGDKISSGPSGENPESKQGSQTVLSPCLQGENTVCDPEINGTR